MDKTTPKPLDTKIRVGAVSYLNTLPLLYGINHSPISAQLDISLDYPARIAEHLINNRIDIGLVPIAEMHSVPNAQIVSDYGIACKGPVASVCIFSKQPLEQCNTLLLDYQSRSSVALAKILLKQYWKKEIRFQDTAGDDFINQIGGDVAGLLIGDRALEYSRQSPYIYDLGEAWYDFTGLGFVFAAWISNKKMTENFIQDFNAANALGLKQLDQVISAHPYTAYDLHRYYNQNIRYQLDESCFAGMQLFLQMMH